MPSRTCRSSPIIVIIADAAQLAPAGSNASTRAWGTRSQRREVEHGTEGSLKRLATATSGERHDNRVMPSQLVPSSNTYALAHTSWTCLRAIEKPTAPVVSSRELLTAVVTHRTLPHSAAQTGPDSQIGDTRMQHDRLWSDKKGVWPDQNRQTRHRTSGARTARGPEESGAGDAKPSAWVWSGLRYATCSWRVTGFACGLLGGHWITACEY